MEPMLLLLLLQEEAFCCAGARQRLALWRTGSGYERTIYASVGWAFDRTAAGRQLLLFHTYQTRFTGSGLR